MRLYHFFRKILELISTLVGATFFVFALFYLVGSDPARIKLGKYATAELVAWTRHELGLDQPFLVQYLTFAKKILMFDFGKSWVWDTPIWPMIKERALVSLSFTLPTFIISSCINIILALVFVAYRSKWMDSIFSLGTSIIMSLSVLSYILFSQYILAYKLNLFPIAGYEYGFPYYIPYILLPCLIIITLAIAYDVPLYRSIILEQIYQDYVRTAQAKGLSQYAVLFKHVLKNAIIPILTHIVIQIPGLIVSSILIESFFAIPGLGTFIVEAIYNGDFPIIQAVTILTAIAYALCILLADLMYSSIDTRVQTG